MAKEAERAESLTSHSLHGLKQNAKASYVYLDISRMVFTTTNSTHKPKDIELEIKNKSPVFKQQLFSLYLCLSLFWADSMIRIQLHIQKKGTLLQNMQRCSRNLVGMSWPRKIRCFHKRFCNNVLAIVIALGHPEPFNHSLGHLNMKTPPLPPALHPIMTTYLLLLNESGHSHCISFAIAEWCWSLIWIQMFHSFLNQIHDTAE